MCFCALLNCALAAPVSAGAVVSSSHAPALAYAEQLACVLIANLGDGGLAAKTGTEGTQLPTVAALADSLLGSLLKAFPALYNSQACYAALLAQLQEEEGDAPMGQVGGCACRLVCVSLRLRFVNNKIGGIATAAHVSGLLQAVLYGIIDLHGGESFDLT